MKTVFITLLLIISFSNCSCSNVKLHPEYKGVDPKVQVLVNEYKDLAKKQGIVFDKEVTVGFKYMGGGTVIGRCTYGWGWREVDLDQWFWITSSDIVAKALLFHELTHAYCDREHDYSEGNYYPSPAEIDDPDYVIPKDGYYPDKCPLSIMYPIIVDEDCLKKHLEDYEIEMFNRCSPY